MPKPETVTTAELRTGMVVHRIVFRTRFGPEYVQDIPHTVYSEVVDVAPSDVIVGGFNVTWEDTLGRRTAGHGPTETFTLA